MTSHFALVVVNIAGIPTYCNTIEACWIAVFIHVAVNIGVAESSVCTSVVEVASALLLLARSIVDP